MSAGGWRVLLWDDDWNTLATAAFVLYRVVGLPLGKAIDLPREASDNGAAEVAVVADRFEAEVLVGRLQVFGLHAGLVAA